MGEGVMTTKDVDGGDVQIGQELSNVPMGEMIRSIAMGVARAQFELDKSSMRVSELMSGQSISRDTYGRLLNHKGEPSRDAAEAPVIYDSRVYFGYDMIGDQRIPTRVSMMELGFTPTFYQFVDTIIEVKIAIKIKREALKEDKKKGVETDYGPTSASSSSHSTSYGWGGGWWGWGGGSTSTTSTSRTRTVVTTTPVNSRYSSKFNYSAEGSSLLRTKLVPVPVPPIFEERVQQLIDQRRAEVAAQDEERNRAFLKLPGASEEDEAPEEEEAPKKKGS